MTIKSDRWIRKMALEKKMIEPFVESQVREGVVSYGLSSYGYDLRVADEFKIFTNINSTVVDPKKFDESSFVDVRGNCLIPPNSFALARTVEYLRIPRNVVTICLSKSTYARCFSADTRVALVDGTAPTLEEMARRAEDGELFWGYSVGEHGRIVVTLLDEPRLIGRDSLLELTLDNERTIRCTPDHVFLLRDGRTAEAAALRPGDALMPLYRQLARGYESVYQPLNGFLSPTHRLADEWNLRNGIYVDAPGTHRHHRDHDRRNNAPWNIERVPASDHIRHHDARTYGDDFDPDEHGQAIRAAFERLASDPAWREEFSRVQRERALAFWNHEAYAAKREALRRAHVANWTEVRRREQAAALRARFSSPEARQEHRAKMRAAWAQDPERRTRQAEVARTVRLRPEITAEVVRRALDETGSIRGAARVLGCDRAVFRRFPEVLSSFRGLARTGGRNHKVTSIRQCPGEHDVYCLTVPEAGNFALDAGVFVRNCGIIVNVTPFEPEWEGHATLEISNTTPLPARIYANEGLCQVLFFESDEVCEVSYADKKGKYQGQGPEIVLPRM
ncbi:MAG: dCTP deaminase [Planctomycetota bacterium]|nr:dCTP deaminase [Planctomycetota bacterium]